MKFSPVILLPLLGLALAAPAVEGQNTEAAAQDKRWEGKRWEDGVEDKRWEGKRWEDGAEDKRWEGKRWEGWC